MPERYDYVLIGSFAAVWAAQSIRERDKEGTIAIFGAENYPPYDRPPLSKDYLAKEEIAIDDAYSKFDDFYPKNQIDLHKGARVATIDRNQKTVTLESGSTVGYGKLLIATGSHPKPLNVPGAHRPHVHLLRTLDDSLAIREEIRTRKRLVIVGAGYIGMEVAADAKTRGLEVAVVDLAGHPWNRFASEKLGKFLQDYYTQRGVQFYLNDAVASLDGVDDNGPVTGVTTKNGKHLPADFVVAGVGVTLNTDLAKAAGLDVDETDGVRVDEYLQTADPHIWVAGDIAFFKDVALETEWHCEHHLNAKWQGQAAGANMVGPRQPYDKVAYFFSDEFDIHMVLRGNPRAGKQSILTGDVAGAEFVELYHDDAGRLTMGIAISHEEPKLDPIAETLERLIRAKVNLKGREAELQSPGFNLSSFA